MKPALAMGKEIACLWALQLDGIAVTSIMYKGSKF